MADFSQFAEKKVIIQLKDGTEYEGAVEAASAVGLVLKEKGTRQTRLIEADAVAAIETIEPKAKKLRSRALPVPNDGKYRQHLIERHGYRVSDIEKINEAEAKDLHNSLDHSDLGHTHRNKTEAELAIEQAAADAAVDGE